MEPSDIDKIIKEKLSGNNDLHKHERDTAKPFIWSAVQTEITKKPTVKWYHLAAAIILLAVAFSFVIYSVERSHENKVNQLSEKLDHLEKRYTLQSVMLNTKNEQIDSLGNELRNVALKFSDFQPEKQVIQKKEFFYRSDTVYIKQFEYIANPVTPEELKELDTIKDEPLLVEAPKEGSIETNFAIYANDPEEKETSQSESFKLKFGSFASKNN